MAIPNKTKAYLYKYERLLMGISKKLLKQEHGSTFANKLFQKYNYVKAKLSYDDVYGEYLYYDFTIDNGQEDDTIWIDL